MVVVCSLVILAAVLVMTGFLMRAFVPARHRRLGLCQSHLKELGLAFTMYVNDNHGGLPSSAIAHNSDRAFRMTLGVVPPTNPGASGQTTVFGALYPYKRNLNLYFCPSDPSGPSMRKPSTPTSYVLKRAINQAWLNPKIKARKMRDYRWPAQQLLFYERRSFHWRDRHGDLSDQNNVDRLGARMNCVFMDTHVKTIRLLPLDERSGGNLLGEPDYYNWNMKTDKPVKRGEIDPRVYADRLE
ncbi:MAG: hypothetical protein Q7T82_13100 [Armatimonadota bacterium]|nr:hypothetical protein [Armatimonadota bacterium]